MLDGIRAAQQEGLTLEQAKDRFAVHKRFPHFWQRQSAQWAKAKQDRNIETNRKKVTAGRGIVTCGAPAVRTNKPSHTD